MQNTRTFHGRVASSRPTSKFGSRHFKSRTTPFWLSMLFGLALVASACGNTADSANNTGLSGKSVAFVGYGDANPWGAYFNEVFNKAMKNEGVEVADLTTLDPGTAVQNFNQAIASKPDLIVVSLVDPKAMVVPIQKAKAAGIPVLVFDGRPDPSVDEDVMQVISDNEALGTAAAQNLIEGLRAQGRTSGAIIAITGAASSLVTQDRMAGFHAEMASAPEFEVIDEQDGNWDPTRSGEIATQLLAKYGCDGVQGAYGMADYMALPIIAAAKQAGCAVAGDNGLVVTSSNCFAAGIAAIQDGSLYGTATEDPGTIATQTADYAIRFLAGDNPDRKEMVKEDRVTAANVSEFAEQCSHA